MMEYPDTAPRRWLHQAPLFLWRLGLGPLLGRVFMLLTTRGRRSGRPRRTTVARRVMDGRLYAWCPYGERAQWYRNVGADPRVTVQTRGGPRGAVVSRVTDGEELTRVYWMMKETDPAGLAWYLERVGIRDDPTELLAHRDRVHFLRFDPAPDSGLRGQPADLAWIWGVAALAVGCWWGRRG